MYLVQWQGLQLLPAEVTAKPSRAVLRQRQGKDKRAEMLPDDGAFEPTLRPKRPYDTTNRPRRSLKASGHRGLYDSPEWHAKRNAWKRDHPTCVNAGTVIACEITATVADHVERVTDPNSYEQVILGEIQSMCGRCHQQKSADDRARDAGREPKPIQRRVEIDPETGYPLPGQPWHSWSE